MQHRRITGPGAGVAKYDLLTALSLAGLRGSKSVQTSILRLSALITSRYNWQRDEVTIGHRDLARLWSVDERTVKREIKRLTGGLGLSVLRPGVRGRVTAYRLQRDAIATLSRPHWFDAGPDFAARMALHLPDEPAMPVIAPPVADGTGWQAVLATLSREDPASYANWYERIHFAGEEGETILLQADSAFVCRYIANHLSAPLTAAVRAEFGPGKRLSLIPAEASRQGSAVAFDLG